MNNNGVAMAADSTVTVGNKKTFNGVNKVFKISDHPPMGMMISGNARFNNVPMETLINEFSKNCDFNVNNNIGLIKNDFLKFVGENTDHTDVKQKIEFLLKPFGDVITSKTEDLSEEKCIDFFKCSNIFDLPAFVKNSPEFSEYDHEFKKIIPKSISKNNRRLILKQIKKHVFQ